MTTQRFMAAVAVLGAWLTGCSGGDEASEPRVIAGEIRADVSLNWAATLPEFRTLAESPRGEEPCPPGSTDLQGAQIVVVDAAGVKVGVGRAEAEGAWWSERTPKLECRLGFEIEVAGESPIYTLQIPAVDDEYTVQADALAEPVVLSYGS